MKVSRNWLRDYLDIDLQPSVIADILTEIGLEVEGFEINEPIRGGLKDLIVGEVLTCVKHPNADRLSLTTVDIGGNILQIVCGAPNVASGQKVVVAPVGTTLYGKDGKPWQIQKGKIRGEVSEGMICAADEIGTGDDHSGIIVLDHTFEVGKAYASYFDLTEDVIFEVGLTPNRSDATSQLGIARDLYAALKVNYGYSGTIHFPVVDQLLLPTVGTSLKVEVVNSEACPRYAGLTIEGVHIGPSPLWLQRRLESIGVRAINNVVDVTNFVLHELGQPLHAFDLEKIKGKGIRVQTLAGGTPFHSLDGQIRSLHQDDLMICDAEDNGMCIAGVFGGWDSGVKDGTSAIFLESAHFNAKYIRRTSGRHQLFTEAAKIFEKGSDPNICTYALKRAAQMICELSGSRITSDIIDVYPTPFKNAKIKLRFSQLARITGVLIPQDQVNQILDALDMAVVSRDGDSITVEVPSNKVDVTREADLIEEILRIYGFNRIEMPNRLSFAVGRSEGTDPFLIRNRASDFLVSQGFLEIMGLSMIDKKYVDNPVWELKDQEIVRINNTSNIQIEVMRPNLIITALETVRYNQNRQQNRLRFFEFGKSYHAMEGDFMEEDHLTITINGWQGESWLEKPLPAYVGYYALKSVVENILVMFGISSTDRYQLEHTYWQEGQEYRVNDTVLVRFGKVNQTLCEEMDLRNPVYIADFHWNQILKYQQKGVVITREMSKFPVVRRDLALVVDQGVSFGEISALIHSFSGEVLKEINLFDVYENAESLGKGKKSYAISLLFSDPGKTFADKEIDLMVDKILQVLAKEADARLR